MPSRAPTAVAAPRRQYYASGTGNQTGVTPVAGGHEDSGDRQGQHRRIAREQVARGRARRGLRSPGRLRPRPGRGAGAKHRRCAGRRRGSTAGRPRPGGARRRNRAGRGARGQGRDRRGEPDRRAGVRQPGADRGRRAVGPVRARVQLAGLGELRRPAAWHEPLLRRRPRGAGAGRGTHQRRRARAGLPRRRHRDGDRRRPAAAVVRTGQAKRRQPQDRAAHRPLRTRPGRSGRSQALPRRSIGRPDGCDAPAGAARPGVRAAEAVRQCAAYRVDDITAAVERVRAAGGHADEPARRPYGLLAECVDDQGATFRLWQPAD
jgi:hypothetical protein